MSARCPKCGAVQPSNSKRRRFDPNYPTPILDAHVGRIINVLAEYLGRELTTRELADTSGVPIGTLDSRFLRAKLAARGVRRVKRDGRNRWSLAEQRRAAT